MKAVILAAGKGIRLLPLTKNKPKCLLKINDNTILEHQIENLKDCGIDDIIIATGHCTDQIENVCKDDAKCVYNPLYATTNNIYSLWCARSELKGHGFVCLHGDVLFHKEILKKCLQTKGDICLIIERGCDEETTIRVKIKNNLITEIDKSPLNEVYGRSIGIAKFSEKGSEIMIKEIEAIVEKGGHLNKFFTFVINKLIQKGYAVCFSQPDGYPWFEVDNKEDLEKARKIVYPLISNKVMK